MIFHKNISKAAFCDNRYQKLRILIKLKCVRQANNRKTISLRNTPQIITALGTQPAQGIPPIETPSLILGVIFFL